MSDEIRLAACESIMRNLMREHLPVSVYGSWSFSWDKAVRRLGQTDYNKRRITLSRPIALIIGPERMRDTMLHEIAHVIAGRDAAHGPAWRAVCRRIGAIPNACASTVDLSLDVPLLAYVGTCPNGHQHSAGRMPKYRRACRLCSPTFDARFLITYRKRS